MKNRMMNVNVLVLGNDMEMTGSRFEMDYDTKRVTKTACEKICMLADGIIKIGQKIVQKGGTEMRIRLVVNGESSATTIPLNLGVEEIIVPKMIANILKANTNLGFKFKPIMIHPWPLWAEGTESNISPVGKITVSGESPEYGQMNISCANFNKGGLWLDTETVLLSLISISKLDRYNLRYTDFEKGIEYEEEDADKIAVYSDLLLVSLKKGKEMAGL